MLRKQFDVEVQEKRENGGRILISTGAVDRAHDRVLPEGVQMGNYMKNPVVQWGHNYYEPWATIGRTESLEVTSEGIIAEFELRPAANESDPQSVIKLLWAGDWVRTASIGFIPITSSENETGGRDFETWELLEWSLVPVPANQEALRLAVKGLEASRRAAEPETDGDPEETAPDALQETPGKDSAESPSGAAVTWVRRLTVRNNQDQEQVLFACFYAYEIEVAEDETKLDIDEDGELIEIPHPDAGQTVKRKEVNFTPPLAFYNEKWFDDAMYSIGGPAAQPDEELVQTGDNKWTVLDLSGVLCELPVTKFWQARKLQGVGLCKLTRRAVDVAQQLLRRRLGQGGAEDDRENDEEPGEQDDENPEREELDALAREISSLRRILDLDALRRILNELKGVLSDE